MLQVTGTLSSGAARASMVGVTMANANHDMCTYGITAPPAAAPQRKPTGLLDHHSTDRHGQSGEDRHVRKALVLVSAKSAGVKYFLFWPQTGHCSLQSSARDCTEKCQEDFMLDLQTASPDSKHK